MFVGMCLVICLVLFFVVFAVVAAVVVSGVVGVTGVAKAVRSTAAGHWTW